jgi:hypothetical protein
VTASPGRRARAPAAPAGERDHEPRWGARKRASMRWRGATRAGRVLPDFLVLGGQRCGSTSLFAILCDHRQVIAPSHKEVHFFDRNYLRGPEFYRRVFPLALHRRARARRLGRRVVTGEATTYYLFHPAVPARVAQLLPQARLIALLRDPVDRAYSHYQLSVRTGHEPLSFEDALAAEPERLAGEEERLATEAGYRSLAHRYHSYVARGTYVDQLLRWYAHVDRERLLVLRSEDLFERPEAVVAQVTGFLGVEAYRGHLPEPRNRVTYGGMRPETREWLRERFDEPNRRLVALLGRELGWQRPGD